jgi:hypothetical protein
MENALSAGIIFGVVGATLVGGAGIVKNNIAKMNGNHWELVRTDPGLSDLISRLNQFKKYDEATFMKIGDTFETMISLYQLSQTDTKKHYSLPFRVFKLRNQVNSLLGEFSNSVVETIDKTPLREMAFEERAQRKTDFNFLADEVSSAARVYFNKMLE